MSWRFPRHLIGSEDVVGVDDVNENLQEFVEETTSNLNEHNWAAGSFNGTHVGDGEVFRWKAGGRTDVTWWSPHGEYLTNSTVVRRSMSWEVVPRCTVTVETGDCLLWIFGSAQHQAANTGGMAYGVRIDGVLIPESVTCTSELEQFECVLGRDNESGVSTGWNVPGLVQRFRQPLVVEALIGVSPGSHVVDFVYKTVWDAAQRGGDGTTVLHSVRELFVIEMAR